MPVTTIQIRLGQKSPEKLKKWAENQSNLNDSVKRVLDHFIDIYGQESIDSLEVKLRMARDLVAAQGSDDIKRPYDPNDFYIVEERKPNPKEIPEEKKKITHRGTIDI